MRRWKQLVPLKHMTGFRHLEHHRRRLEMIEKIVFPPQMFVSMGTIVHEAGVFNLRWKTMMNVNILRGKPYMGEFCHVIIKRRTAWITYL